MNALDDYLSRKGISNAAFAELVGASESTISRLRRDLQGKSFDLLERIAEKTDWEVTPNDFLPPRAAENLEAPK